MIDLPDVLQARPAGERSWMAKCPAHEDRSPSLRITRAEDRWLIHCLAQCTPDEICAAIEISMSDLFEADELDARARRDWKLRRQVLDETRFELTVMAVYEFTTVPNSVKDEQRYQVAKDRINTAIDYFGSQIVLEALYR